MAHTVEDTIALNRRNAAYMLTSGMGMWWYDFGPQHVKKGWWDEPRMLADIGRLLGLANDEAARPYRPAGDVLLVYDTDVFYYLAPLRSKKDPVSYAAVDLLANQAHCTGAAVDKVLLMDLPRVDLTQYRTVLFANTFRLTSEQRRFIREKVASGGRTVVWVYAPGYVSEDRLLDAAALSELTGIGLKPVEVPGAPEIAVEYGEVRARLRVSDPVTPLFAVDDAEAVALGLYSGSNETGMAVKKTAAGTAIFCGLPPANFELLQAMFRESGAHIYNDSGDVVLADDRYLAIHSVAGGSRVLTLRGGKQVTVGIPPRSTTIFDAEDGHVLLDAPGAGR
jgi:hypothetical protein